MEELIIVGAGVAGLSCLNALLDEGVSPLLLEAGKIGTPKLCGEFLAPPAVPILQRWGVPDLHEIHDVQFHHTAMPWRVPFTRPAAAILRHVAEMALAQRARGLGARIREHSPIQEIIPATASQPFRLQCVSGEVLQAKQVIFATGKITQTHADTRVSGYVGFKTYIPQVLSRQGLDMFPLKQGYLGVIPVAPACSNLTCLIHARVVAAAGGSEAFLRNFMRNQPLFNSLEPQWQTWLEGQAPVFGAKILPQWPGAWWIGDALAAIHPAIGYGFAHSVVSALFVSACVMHQASRSHRQLRARMRATLRVSGLLHQLLQHPGGLRLLTPLLRRYSAISHLMIKQLDY